MSLPSSGPISTDDIMGPNGLNIGVQTMEWSALWALAVPGSIPKNKANAGGPYVLPNDWHGYTHVTGFAFSFSSGFTESTSICTKTATQTLYAAVATLVEGTIMYSDPGLTTPVNGGSRYFRNLTDNTYVFIFTNAINAPKSCVPFGGSILLDIPGVGNNIPPDCPGCSVRSGYTKGSSITIRNTSSTETIKFLTASSYPPYPVIVEQGACRMMNHTSTTAAYFLTCPSGGEQIPPSSSASWLAFNKSSGGGIIILSMERESNTGTVITDYWTFNV